MTSSILILVKCRDLCPAYILEYLNFLNSYSPYLFVRQKITSSTPLSSLLIMMVYLKENTKFGNNFIVLLALPFWFITLNTRFNIQKNKEYIGSQNISIFSKSNLCKFESTSQKAWEGFNIPMDKYVLPDDFLEKMKKVIEYSPCSIKTKKKRVILTLFSSHHSFIVANLLCSIVHLKNYSQNYHLFISYDYEGYNFLKHFSKKLQSFNFSLAEDRIIWLNVDERKFGYEEYTKMKSIIQYQLALWNVESVIVDSDVVLFRDISPIFEDNFDITIAAENCCLFKLDKTFNFDEFNIGLNRFIPSPETLFVFREWFNKSIPSPEIDQKILQYLLSPHRIPHNSSENNIQYYKFNEFERLLSVKFIHPLDFLNGGMILLQLYRTKLEMKRQNKTNPYGIHFAWIVDSQKIPFMKQHNFWYFDDQKEQCLANPPKQFFE